MGLLQIPQPFLGFNESQVGGSLQVMHCLLGVLILQVQQGSLVVRLGIGLVQFDGLGQRRHCFNPIFQANVCHTSPKPYLCHIWVVHIPFAKRIQGIFVILLTQLKITQVAIKLLITIYTGKVSIPIGGFSVFNITTLQQQIPLPQTRLLYDQRRSMIMHCSALLVVLLMANQSHKVVRHPSIVPTERFVFIRKEIVQRLFGFFLYTHSFPQSKHLLTRLNTGKMAPKTTLTTSVNTSGTFFFPTFSD